MPYTIGNFDKADYFGKNPDKALALFKWLRENQDVNIQNLSWPKLTNNCNYNSDYKTIESVLKALEINQNQKIRKQNGESMIKYFNSVPEIRSLKIGQLCTYIGITQFIMHK